MPPKIIVTQQTAANRKLIRNTGIAVFILFGGLYWIVQNPLWGNIFRLCAFIGFAAMLINYLQKGRKVETIELEKDEENLTINYFTDGKKRREEIYEIRTIDSIQPVSASPIFKIIPRDDCVRFEISFTDSGKILSLFRFQDRDLLVSKPDAGKVEDFISQNTDDLMRP